MSKITFIRVAMGMYNLNLGAAKRLADRVWRAMGFFPTQYCPEDQVTLMATHARNEYRAMT